MPTEQSNLRAEAYRPYVPSAYLLSVQRRNADPLYKALSEAALWPAQETRADVIYSQSLTEPWKRATAVRLLSL